MGNQILNSGPPILVDNLAVSIEVDPASVRFLKYHQLQSLSKLLLMNSTHELEEYI